MSSAKQPANAIELEELRRRNGELEFVCRTLTDFTSTLSMREVLERLMTRVLRHLGAEMGSILVSGPDEQLRIAVSRGIPSAVVNKTCLRLGDGISGHVALSGRPLLISDIESDSRFRRRSHERYYTRSLLSAPLIQRNEILGVVNVNNKSSREPFDDSDLRLVEAIAANASIALRNASEYESLLDRAQRDPLTGLANHGHFWRTLEVESRRAERYTSDLSVVVLDVDHFKKFNDDHGHPSGDEALRAVSRVLSGLSRSHDLVARYGGEEFAVILAQTNREGALAFAEKVRHGIEGARFGPHDERQVTVSVGVAESHRGQLSPQQLVERADAQLYRAKDLGRNRVHGEACA